MYGIAIYTLKIFITAFFMYIIVFWMEYVIIHSKLHFF